MSKAKERKEYLKALAKNIPQKPGVYQFLDKQGKIIYIGKAKRLRNRVNSYFTGKKEQESPFISPDRPIHLQPSANDAVPRADSKSMVGLPIPGFEFEVEQQPSENIRLEVQPILADKIIQAEEKDGSPNILSKTSCFVCWW